MSNGKPSPAPIWDARNDDESFLSRSKPLCKHVEIHALGGLGDQVLALSCADIVENAGHVAFITSYSRPEVFRALKHLAGDKYTLIRVDEEKASNYCLLDGRLEKNKWGDEIYVVCPDLLFCSSYAFNWKKYKVGIDYVRKNQIFKEKFNPIPKTCYFGLNSSTDGYIFSDVIGLAFDCAKAAPDWTFHLPLISNWGGKVLKWKTYPNPPANLIIYHDPDICDQIDLMFRCEYSLVADNGFSHIVSRSTSDYTLLDPHFKQALWDARWRAFPEKSLPIHIMKELLVEFVVYYLKTPQLRLLPAFDVCRLIAMGRTNWTQELGLKF